MSWRNNPIAANLLEPVRFVMVGFVNTAVGLGVIYLTKLLLGFGDVVANATGYACGLTVSYALNSTWTFGYRGRNVTAACKFVLAFAISYAANLSTVWFLIERASVNSYVAQALGIVPYTACFYLLSKFLVFRRVPMDRPKPLSVDDGG